MDHLDYRIEFTPAAVRQLRKVDPQTRRRIQAAVELLATQPRPPGAKKLVGGDGEWRVRTGDYRIVYQVRDNALLVLVIAIGHRSSIHRDRT
jgi:mRNA interferase RelE/StbE